MQRRTAFEQVFVLNDEEATAGVTGCDLEANSAEAQRVMLAKAILIGADHVNLSGGRSGGLGKDEVSHAGGREQCGCRLEERTTLHLVLLIE